MLIFQGVSYGSCESIGKSWEKWKNHLACCPGTSPLNEGPYTHHFPITKALLKPISGVTSGGFTLNSHEGVVRYFKAYPQKNDMNCLRHLC